MDAVTAAGSFHQSATVMSITGSPASPSIIFPPDFD